MSLASSPKRSLDRGPCITIKAEEPCTATAYNQKRHTDSNEPSPKRIRSSTASGLRRSPNKWTKEENQKLTALVAHYGEKKWKRISADLGGLKTGAQCAQHWKRVLSPDIRKGHWDEIEEELLLRLVIQYGSCWKKIAKKIPQRTDIQCRYQYLKAKQSREVPWDPKEDDVLIKKVVEMANCSFAKFSSDSKDKGSAANDNSLTGASSTAVPSCYVNSHIFAEKENNAHGYGCVNSDSATNPASTGWSSNLGFCAELLRVVWLEVAEHMARMKLTSSLRTALECKTRFTELLGTTFNSANQEEESHKCFGLKGSGNAFVFSNPLFTTLPSINPHINNDNSRGSDTTNNNTININISNNSDKNNNNITITNNTFSHNITINITNTHGPFTPNPSLHTTNNIQPLTKPEPNLNSSHKETPPLPNFHTVVQPLIADTKQTQGIVVMSFLSGLDSLATVASTLPHEMLVSDASSPTCKATNLS
jgi:hypothetical protein